jgi:hypothetical protein
MREIARMLSLKESRYGKAIDVYRIALPFLPTDETTVVVTTIDAAGEDTVGKHRSHVYSMPYKTSGMPVSIHSYSHFAVCNREFEVVKIPGTPN